MQACPTRQATFRTPQPLTVPGLMATLRGLGQEAGTGAAKRRQAGVLRLLRCCRDPAETKYLVRTLVQVNT